MFYGSSMSYFSKYLKNYEELNFLVRKHPAAFLRETFLTLLFILLPFFLMSLLFSWGGAGLIIFGALLLFALFFLLKLLVLWQKNVFLITDKRIVLIRQYGFFDKQVSEMNLNEIQNIAYRVKGLKQTLFNFGSLRIQKINNPGVLFVSDVPKPEKLQQALLKFRQKQSIIDR